MNSVTLLGRITKDFDGAYSQKGNLIARTSLAINRNYKDANGDQGVDFINITAFNKTAENLGKHVKKGERVLIQGHIQTGSYQNKEGKKIYTTEVIVDRFEFIESSKKQEQKSQVIDITADDLPF
ncbi:single-stranded DNA-binding protein [Enterococcus phage vB_EfaP_Ef7.4]|uniref:Single-stranded DNA-binding protein n=1 Tax=Enterococcus phage vB_EfaP_Ef7.4 TaxID=2546620 RepID=A0A4D6DT82_9CAUD|nr:single strand DNA binding protein [Enterococcus phage vB_EfaP_Ef7.4]QBZ69577.1 single-stranded DNA-binding protein [Enterococcus phage vB_EfaP_Ef7.4]